MSESLSRQETEEEENTEDKIIKIIESPKLCQNANCYAFTATPKNKTLELFGVKNPADGKFYSFHNYSMKQAIEEGFILDILQHYTTYKTYFWLENKIVEHPEFDNKQAKKKLKIYVEEHPETIEKKSRGDAIAFFIKCNFSGKS